MISGKVSKVRHKTYETGKQGKPEFSFVVML